MWLIEQISFWLFKGIIQVKWDHKTDIIQDIWTIGHRQLKGKSCDLLEKLSPVLEMIQPSDEINLHEMLIL